MGGSGGGGTFYSRTPSQAWEQVKNAEAKTTAAAFEATLAKTFSELLANFNSRDHALVNQRLSELKGALGKEIDGSVDQLFGGSVAKHTYVDGLSDIDSLLFIDDTSLQGKNPNVVLRKLERILARSFSTEAEISHGRMAVTIQYKDGMTLQVLPALRTEGDHVQVPSSKFNGEWSRVNPITFQRVLTKRNDQCGGKLIPTIKLAKAINGELPESQRLSGYHMESLAVSAFRAYNGQKTTTAMLPTFFERAKELVLSPITDKSGQSVHVDGYLGAIGSDARRSLSHVFGRIARRMRNASAAGSTDQWRAMFGLED